MFDERSIGLTNHWPTTEASVTPRTDTEILAAERAAIQLSHEAEVLQLLMDGDPRDSDKEKIARILWGEGIGY